MADAGDFHDAHFEWSLAKAARNERKHGISFEEAVRVFDYEAYLEAFDAVHSDAEDRYRVIGLIGSDLVCVVYADRGTRRRIISAHYADDDDKDMYARQFG
jgi:uncharacterized DUF497 family protein